MMGNASGTAFNLERDVVEPGLCAGCGLCEAIARPDAIRVHLDRFGYFRPKVVRTPSSSVTKLIKACCPGVQLVRRSGSVPYHPLWGPILSVNTGYTTDEALRHQGSSGGVVSAIGLFLLETNKVDFVAQVSAPSNDPLGNELQLSRTRDQILHAAGSRYGPSAPLRKVIELLDGGHTFAFIGKPCDVAALRQFSKFDPRVQRQIPYMLSFICAGVPSRNGSLELIDRLGIAEQGLVSLRYRGEGWPGKVQAITSAGEVRDMDYATSWGTILNKHLQFRCKVCADGTGEFADIVGADAWYSENGYPSFEERAGRSLVIARTALGQALLDELCLANRIVLTPLPIRELSDLQPYQKARKSLVLGRLVGHALATGRTVRYRRMGLLRASLSASPSHLLRNLVGTYRRARRERTKQRRTV
jgi:coenzyme F420 hydrogenase subunit beta